MRRFPFTIQPLALIGAGIVLGVVSVWGISRHYSPRAAAGEGNFPLPHPQPRRPIPSAPVFDRKAPKSGWNFLTHDVRTQIDAAAVRVGHWKMIVLHSSATASGSARALDYYHREVKHLAAGLAYHFVIGNGRGAGDGAVAVGSRWSQQEAGGHLSNDAQNEVALGICVVGNFSHSAPTLAQIEALDELIDYLQAKLGKIPVTTHALLPSGASGCPGAGFPSAQFVE